MVGGILFTFYQVGLLPFFSFFFLVSKVIPLYQNDYIWFIYKIKAFSLFS